ncbi:MAG: exonuclease domain-containing protein [Huintestinicola sp.]
MNYIFLDMEWNQPHGRSNTVTVPVPLHGEIIRIGAVKVNENMQETDRIHVCVIPKYYKKMNSTVKRVTGLSGASITFGQKFPDAYKRFADWCGEDSVILTWGSEDEKMLDTNLLVHKLGISHPKFYDLQQIFAHRIMEDSRQYSLMAALEHYGITCELKAHDALNDAVYCSRIGLRMEFSRYLEGYEEMLREAAQEKQEKYFRTFMNVKSVEAAMASRRITFCRCPKCRRIMKRQKWVFYSETSVINCCQCREHGEYYVRIKMKKCPDGTYAVTKKYTRMTAEYRDFYLRCCESEKRESASVTL